MKTSHAARFLEPSFHRFVLGTLRSQFALILVFATAGIAAAQRTRGQQAQPAKAYNSIRQIDFKNFDYGHGENLVRIRRGKGKISDGEVSDVAVAYGDLTGDGEDEAVVLLSGMGNNGGGFNWQVSAGPFVYTLNNGRPKPLEEGVMGKIPGTVMEVTISHSLIFVRFMISSNGRDMERTRGLWAFHWSGISFDKVDALPPSNSGTRYFFRLFNCDDSCGASVNGDSAFVNADGAVETKFAEDGGWIDITEMLQDGRNQIKFTVKNESGGIAYGIRVARNDQIVFEKICGQAGRIGCENNRVFPKGVAREFTYTIMK